MPRFSILFCAAFAFFVAFVHGGMYWHDSPEFIMTSFFLLPSHPAGSPAYSMVAHLLTWLPIGPIPARVALLSAVSSAAVLSGLALWASLAIRRPPSPFRMETILISGLAAAALLGSPTLRTYAAVPEVYSFHAAILAASLGLAGLPGARGRLAGAFAIGIASSVHFSTLFYLPLFFSIPHSGQRIAVGRGAAIRRLPSAGVPIFIGFSAHLFLMLRAIPEAPVYWGDLSNPLLALRHLLGASEYGYLWRLSGSDLVPQLQEFARKLSREVPLPLLGFAAVGLALGLRWKVRPTIAVLFGCGLHLAFFIRFESFPAQYYMVWLSIAFAATLGAAFILAPARWSWLRTMAGIGVGALAVFGLYNASVAQAGFRSFAQEPSVEFTLDAVPPKGILVHTGQFAFQAAYLESIEHRRPDIRPISLLREGLTAPDQMRIVLPHLSARRPTALRTDIDPTLFQETDAAGPVFVIGQAPGQAPMAVIRAKWRRVAGRFAEPPPPDFPTAANSARMAASEARWHLWHGRLDEAQDRFATALAIQPGYATATEGLGRIAEIEGRKEEAIRLYREALSNLSPASPLREKYRETFEKAESAATRSGAPPPQGHPPVPNASPTPP